METDRTGKSTSGIWLTPDDGGGANADYVTLVQEKTYEAVLETSYVIQLNKYLGLQPDIQYIIRPNGYGNIPNALVIGLQAVQSGPVK